MVQVTHKNGTTNTTGVSNTTPPYGTVDAQIVKTDTKILLGGDNISDNQINDVYLRIVNSDGTFDVRISSIGKCTEKGVNDIEVELTNINSWKLPLTIKEVTYKTSSEVHPENIKLKSFPLSNIDEERLRLLRAQTDIPYMIDRTKEPYASAIQCGYFTDCNQIGLVVKTYQSDVFNNWLSTEWIDGTNGINEITAVGIVTGKQIGRAHV